MAVYILVHGSWHGAWCFEKIIPLLEAKGHRVLAPDLPGHGNNQTPIKEITLKSYVDCVIEQIDQVTEQVILVGHSMAGVVISQVAECYARRIQKLIYLTAFIPQNGQSMFDVAAIQPPTRFVKFMRQDIENNAFHFDLKALKGFAYHQCDDALLETIKPRLCVEPLAPSNTPVKLGENFAKVPRVYIECEEDQAILIATQRKILESIPCQTHTLKSDHSPFYSQPEKLAEILLEHK
jgi:pimeloyl-ACP methyl ester carboxylesterase